MKKELTLTMAIAGALLGASMAQESEIDLEARKRTIPIIEGRIKERTAQIAEIGNDILQLHKRVDERLGRMVGHLAAVKDSVQSGFNVGNVKIEMIKGLEKAIEDFQTRRLALERGLREGKSGIPPSIIEHEIHHFDEHVEMHIEQMLELSKSFTKDKDVQRYVSVTGSNSGGYWDGIETNDEWRQNLKDRSTDKKQRAEVKAALEKSIVRCESLISGLRHDLENKNLSVIEQGVLKSELDTHLTMLNRRRSQVDELLVAEEPDTTAVGHEAAKNLGEAVSDLMGDLQRDIQMITLKHSQLSAEQDRLFRLRENLEARKKWLENYEKKGGK
ncbi:MAG: hypothetical protein ACYC67_27060 [Prosthecobacter sp.]